MSDPLASPEMVSAANSLLELRKSHGWRAPQEARALEGYATLITTPPNSSHNYLIEKTDLAVDAAEKFAQALQGDIRPIYTDSERIVMGYVHSVRMTAECLKQATDEWDA